MAVDARAIGAGSIRESDNLTPAISNLQLAFKNGVISGQEIADALIVKPSQQKLQREQNIASLELLPQQQEAARLGLEQDIAQAPARSAVADLEIQARQAELESGLAIQDTVAEKNRLIVEDQLAEFEGLLGAQPFANPQNAASFFERTHPGEKVPTDPKVLEQRNQETFNAIQQFKQHAKRFTGTPTTETFVRVNPDTFDKERVKVTFDGAGNVVREQSLGLVEVGSKGLSEQQANAVQFSARMRQATANLDSIEDSGFDPAGAMNHVAQWFSRNKMGVLASSSAQQYEAAKRNWMAAVLRKESGAAIAQSEYAGADHQYFPQPKDSPETIAQKRRLRDTALTTMQAAGLFGLPPAQKAIIEAQFSGSVGPSSGPIVTKWEVISDSEFAEREAAKGPPPGSQPDGIAAGPREGERITPEDPTLQKLQEFQATGGGVPVAGTPADAAQLPPDVKFFTDPNGVLRRNPNFRGVTSAR